MVCVGRELARPLNETFWQIDDASWDFCGEESLLI